MSHTVLCTGQVTYLQNKTMPRAEKMIIMINFSCPSPSFSACKNYCNLITGGKGCHSDKDKVVLYVVMRQSDNNRVLSTTM